MLGILLTSLIITGYPAFTQTTVRIDFPISEEHVSRDDPAAGNWRQVVTGGIRELVPGEDASPAEIRQISQILTTNTQFMVRDAVVARPLRDRRNADLVGPGLRSLRPARQGPGRP